MTDKRALVTAGPTYEALDPVRFIGNHSSGKMGFAIAEALAEEGAIVDLVTGPTHEHTRHEGIIVHKVVSADDMYEQCVRLFPQANIAVLSAAVADYKPSIRAEQKIKKNGEALNIELVRTPDIAVELGRKKRGDQLLVGFALETEHEVANAKEKLKAKNFDFIVLNSLREAGAGFQGDTNKVQIFGHGDSHLEFPLKPKKDVAVDIVKVIVDAQV